MLIDKIKKHNAKVQEALTQESVYQDTKAPVPETALPELMTVNEALDGIKHQMMMAIVNEVDTLFISSAGIGKTDAFLEEIAQIRYSYKVLVVCQTHELLSQMEATYKRIVRRLVADEQISSTSFSRSEVIHFHGKAHKMMNKFGDEFTLCENQPSTLDPTSLLSSEQLHEYNIRKQHAAVLRAGPNPSSDFCMKECYVFKEDSCKYMLQYKDFANVRFKTINELYNEETRFNKDKDGKNSKWEPNLIIVDDHTFQIKEHSMSKEEVQLSKGLSNFVQDKSDSALVNHRATIGYDLKVWSENKQSLKDKPQTDKVLAEIERLERFITVGSAVLAGDRACVYNTNGFLFAELSTIHDRFKKATVLWFDGSANREIFAHVHPDAQILEYHVAKKPEVQHIRHTALTLSKNRFRETEVNIQKVRDEIQEVCRIHEYKRIGLITYKSIYHGPRKNEYFPDTIAEGLDVEVVRMHFGNTRGKNPMQDCDAIFVVGRYMLAPQALKSYALAIYKETISDDKVSMDKIIRLKGDAVVKKITAYADPRMEALHQHFGAAETLQAVGRGRAYHGAPKSVYIMTGEYLGPYLEYDAEYHFALETGHREKRSAVVKENMAVAQQDRAVSVFDNLVSAIRAQGHKTLDDTKKAFEAIGCSGHRAKSKELRAEVATAAGYQLVQVETKWSRGRTSTKLQWHLV